MAGNVGTTLVVAQNNDKNVGMALVAIQGINIKIYMTDRMATRAIPTSDSCVLK
jgi:hypothetical protein